MVLFITGGVRRNIFSFHGVGTSQKSSEKHWLRKMAREAKNELAMPFEGTIKNKSWPEPRQYRDQKPVNMLS